MRILLLFFVFFLSITQVFARDPAIDANQIYDEILNTSNYVVESYNYPPGKRELNLHGLKNFGQYNLNAVEAPDRENLVYSEVFFYPDTKVTASALYIIPLDSSLPEKEAILSVSTKDKLQQPIIETNYSKLYQFKFNTFTTVDWDKNSNVVLFKEKLGQNYDQIYLTKLFAYNLTDEKLYDLNLVRKKIIEFWADKSVFLEDYKWDIYPLGFMKNNEHIVLVKAYGYYKKERKFLGIFAIDVYGTKPYLYSTKDVMPEISRNGKCLKFIPDMEDIYARQRRIDAKKQQRFIEPRY